LKKAGSQSGSLGKNNQMNNFKILNLGCGLDYIPNAVNVDIDKRFKPDLILDLEEPLPFKSNSFNVVLAFHIFEHIHNFKQLMLELWRILKNDGLLKVKVPSRDHFVAYQDPTYIRFFDLYTFDYFELNSGRKEEREILLDGKFWKIVRKFRINAMDLYFVLTPLKELKLK